MACIVEGQTKVLAAARVEGRWRDEEDIVQSGHLMHCLEGSAVYYLLPYKVAVANFQSTENIHHFPFVTFHWQASCLH